MSVMSHFEILRVCFNFVFNLFSLFWNLYINIKIFIQPGYYGSKGLVIISDILSELFLFNNSLTNDLVFPKKQVDYLQEVLVPETALRLISQDRGNIPLEEAKKIMEDSANFGDNVNINTNSKTATN